MASSAKKRARKNERSGYDAPLVLHAMGEGAIACGNADGSLAEQPVLTLHSNCVLSFDVDRPRAKVREFYGAAAETPQAELCCPTKYDDSADRTFRKDVLDRFYGCGSPMAAAGSGKARSSTSARGPASTSSSPRNSSVRPAGRSAST